MKPSKIVHVDVGQLSANHDAIIAATGLPARMLFGPPVVSDTEREEAFKYFDAIARDQHLFELRQDNYDHRSRMLSRFIISMRPKYGRWRKPLRS